MRILEIACNNYESCVNAYDGGADRIELFENLNVGGCTPSYGMIKKVKEEVGIPVQVMIRPRGGDFVFSNEEFEIMKRDIKLCRDLGVDGIVLGVLNRSGEIDSDRTQMLMEAWGNPRITFHRAIDLTSSIYKSLEVLINIGIERVLTSGGGLNAEEGLAALEDCHRLYKHQIVIMPGAGITTDNIQLFNGFNEIHMTCKVLKSSDIFGDYYISDKTMIQEIKRYQASLHEDTNSF